MSAIVQTLLHQMKATRLPKPTLELKFHPKRRWRFDLAYPERLLAIEVEGGVWTNGRHTRGAGYSADCEKYSEAAILGWRIVRVTSDMVVSGQALDLVTRALEAIREKGTQ
jgi:hypothetical protein